VTTPNDAPVSIFTPHALALLRVMTGLLFLEHGTGKLLGFPASESAHSPALFGLIWWSGVLELVGGLLVALGLMTRPVAFVLAGEMAVAYFMAHAPRSFFPMLNGGDAAVLYCFVFLFLAVAGPGSFSLDSLLRRRKA
jgi:putative oxidoreductase